MFQTEKLFICEKGMKEKIESSNPDDCARWPYNLKEGIPKVTVSAIVYQQYTARSCFLRTCVSVDASVLTKLS